MSVTVYQFWSPTCGPCREIKPALNDLQEEFDQTSWISVNTREDPNGNTQTYGVKVVPTLAVVAKDKEGKVLTVEKQSGTNIANYYRIIRNALKVTQQ